MKIIRWLFSNFFLILLIVVVIYSYMFWGNLAGSDTPAGKAIAYLSTEFVEVEEFINAVKSKQQSMQDAREDEHQQGLASSQGQDAVYESEPRAVATTAIGGTADMSQSADEAQTETAIAFSENIQQQPPVTISYSQNQNRVKQNSAAIVEQLDAASPEFAAVSNSAVPAGEDTAGPATKKSGKDIFVPVEVEKQLENVDGHGKVIDASQQAGSVKDIWVTARKSFYQRDYKLSEESYLRVIDSTEDNFDAYGELGNVYFNQGKNKQAADAYFEAASILVRKGQANRARSLTGLLRHLDRSKAEELKKMIEATRSNNEIKG